VEALQGEGWQGTAHLDISEIVDEESFGAWLEDLPEEGRFKTVLMLAARAVVRVFPFWAANMAEALTENRIDLTVVPVARIALIGGVAVMAQTPQIRSAAAAARDVIVGAPQGFEFSELGNVAVSAAADIAEAVSHTNAEWALGSAQYAAFYVGGSGPYSSMRSDVQRDIRGLAKHSDIRTLPLWPGDLPPEIADAWTKGRKWMEDAPGHAFWLRWYDAILAGRPLTHDWDSHWQLMHDIALIPDEDWGEGKEQDAIRVAEIIAEIEDKYRPTQLSNVDRSTVEAKLSTQEVQAGLRTNRLSLPPTLDAVFGHLELEIQRLSGINHWPTEEAFHEARSLIERLRAMQHAVDQLRMQAECLPEEPSVVDAEEAKSTLGQIYASLKSWPKGKEDELSDATWRIGLIGLTTGVFCLAGAPALVGAGVGGMFFGAKHLEQGAKAVKAFRAMQTEEKED
jgi:hypothetical protein